MTGAHPRDHPLTQRFMWAVEDAVRNGRTDCLPVLLEAVMSLGRKTVRPHAALRRVARRVETACSPEGALGSARVNCFSPPSSFACCRGSCTLLALPSTQTTSRACDCWWSPGRCRPTSANWCAASARMWLCGASSGMVGLGFAAKDAASEIRPHRSSDPTTAFWNLRPRGGASR